MMDWLNGLFVAAATSLVIALSWAGITYSWASPQVLIPLVLGAAGIVAFVWLERWAVNPTVPMAIIVHPTSVIGLIETLLQAMLLLMIGA